MNQYDPLTDEELLLLTRAGDNKAYTLLVRRFLGPSRKGDIAMACPGILGRCSLWEVSSVCLSTFWSCMDGYRFGTVRFKTYYITALRFNLTRYEQNLIKERSRLVSLDMEIGERGDSTLHDIVSADNYFDDPKNFINYYETLDLVKKLPKSIDKESLQIAKMKSRGLSLPEIAEAMKMSYRQVYNKYKRFIQKASEIVKKVD